MNGSENTPSMNFPSTKQPLPPHDVAVVDVASLRPAWPESSAGLWLRISEERAEILAISAAVLI